MNKKTLLFLTALATLIAGWLGTAYSQPPVKLNMGYMKIGDLAPMFLAVDKGFVKEEGLELNLTPMVGGAAIAPALASGALNIGWSNTVTNIIAYTKGFDFKFIANGAINKAGTNDTHALQVLRDSPIRTAKDLEGKIIASNTLANINHVAILFWVDKQGADPAKVKVVELPFPAMEGALKDKKIDAFVAVEPFVTIPAGRTTRILGYPHSEMAPRLLIASYFTTGEWIEKNQDKVRAFIRAINKGIDYLNANKEEAKAAIAKWTGLDPALVAKINLPAFEKEMVLSDIQVWIDLAHKYKFIHKSFKAEEMVHPLAPVKRG